MNPRLLIGVGLAAVVLAVCGLLGVDYPLARWIDASGYANAAFFRETLGVLDALVGMYVWYWLAACTAAGLGLAGMLAGRRLPLPPRLAPALLAAGLVQAATLGLMILGKTVTGRQRPQDVIASGDWSTIWFSGGGSFPSGHAAFFFGLFLPLAAAAPKTWQRVVLLAIPLFVICARLNMLKHFLSDVCASAAIAAAVALIVRAAMRRWLPDPM